MDLLNGYLLRNNCHMWLSRSPSAANLLIVDFFFSSFPVSESFFVTGFSCLEGIDYPEGHPTIKWVDSPLFDYSLDPCLLFWALGNSGSNLSVQHVKCCTERNFNLLGVMSNTAQCLSRKEDYSRRRAFPRVGLNQDTLSRSSQRGSLYFD